MKKFLEKIESKINEYNILISKGVFQDDSQENKLQNEILNLKKELENTENKCLEEKNKIENLKLRLSIQKIQGDIELKELELKNIENKKEEVYKKNVNEYNSSINKKQEEIKSILEEIKKNILESFKIPKNKIDPSINIILPLEIQELKDNFGNLLLEEKNKLEELRRNNSYRYDTIYTIKDNYYDAYSVWEYSSDYGEYTAAQDAKKRMEKEVQGLNERIEKTKIEIGIIEKNIETIKNFIEENVTNYLKKELEKFNELDFIKELSIKF